MDVLSTNLPEHLSGIQMLEEIGRQSPGSCQEVVPCSGGSSTATGGPGGGAIMAAGSPASSLPPLAFAYIPDAILISAPSPRGAADTGGCSMGPSRPSRASCHGMQLASWATSRLCQLAAQIPA